MRGVQFTAARFARLLDRWSDGPGPVSTRLLLAIREHIKSGQLPAGARLPSERQVAGALGIARTTVALAFDTLRGEGLLVSRTGVGTFVSTAGRHAAARGDDRLGSFAHERTPARIDLRSAAVPALPLVGEMIERQAAADFADTLTTHGYVPAGLPILRAAIADYYRRLGLPTEAAQILVTSGAQQAIRLVAQALVEPGDTVLMEEPTYRGAIEVMRSAGVRLVGLPSAEHGIDVAALAEAARHRPTLLLVQSTVHNPTGSVLPDAARAAIAELSGGLGLTIVDHLPGMDTLVDGTIPRPLAAYGGSVLSIGSASKAFWGGLRVGWIRADPGLIRHFTAVKSAEDLGTSIPSQVVTAHLLERIDDARAQRRATLGSARDLMLQKLIERLPEWRPQKPAGGASMWIALPPGHSATVLAEKAGRNGIDLLPGPTFSCEDALDDCVRLAFAAPADVLVAGIDRLAEVWHTAVAS
jgi:DNA-binding transcriptional MocR family regulator